MNTPQPASTTGVSASSSSTAGKPGKRRWLAVLSIAPGSPNRPEAASALFVSAVQTAIAAGSLAGGVVVDHAGATGAMHLGVLLSALGLAVLASFATARRTLAAVLEE